MEDWGIKRLDSPLHSRGLLAVRFGVGVLLVLIVSRTWADPDLWGHVLFGRDIVAARELPRFDPYSFTADKEWINHEWLSEIAMYVAFAAGGGLGLILFKTALMVIAGAVVMISLRPAALSPPVHDLLLFLFVAGTFGRAHAFRPQIFSITLFAILLLVLSTVERGKRTTLLWVPLIFVVWVNLHGGWLVGFAIFGLWTVLKIATEWDQRAAVGRLGVVAATLVATLINPYGWRLWQFVFETVRFEREAIADWQPLWMLSPLPIAIWIATALVLAFTVALRWNSVNSRFASMAFVCGTASVLVSRLDAFFVVATLMLIGPSIPSARSGYSPVTSSRAAPLLIGVVMCTLAAIGLFPRLSCVNIDGTWHPEPEVAALISDRRLTGRMLTYFDWGEYAIWHTAPAIKVSIDGRRETIYSDRVIANHLAVYRNDSAADKIVAAMSPDFVWLPTQSGIVSRLKATGWLLLFQGPVSTLIQSPSLASNVRLATASHTTHRCFPAR